MNAQEMADLSEQLFNVSATIKMNGENHRVVVTDSKDCIFITEEHGRITFRQAAWFLEHGSIEEAALLSSTCGLENCISHQKLAVTAVTDDDLLQLVQRSSTSLADLYRKGKKRGLITATHKGYA